jgi:hypothetical protein
MDALFGPIAPPVSSKFADAAVTSIDPLQVKLSGDATGLDADTLIDTGFLAVADRVRVELSGRRVIVLGRQDGLTLPTASSTVQGIVELASDAETQAGTDAARAVTPAGLASVFGQDGIPYATSQGGSSTASIINSGSTANVTITFPTSRFSQAPRIYGGFDNARLTAGFASITATGATMTHANWSPGAAGAGISYWWLAVQMTPSAKDG